MVARYPNLRIVLMSATIDTQMFHQYFNQCPIIEIEGRSYPVQGEENIKSELFIIQSLLQKCVKTIQEELKIIRKENRWIFEAHNGYLRHIMDI